MGAEIKGIVIDVFLAIIVIFVLIPVSLAAVVLANISDGLFNLVDKVRSWF